MTIVAARIEACGRGVRLVLRDEAGRIGTGEACPLPGVSPDRVEDAAAELAGRPWESGGPESVRAPSARFALETAWTDLESRRLGRPFHELLGLAARPVPVAGLLVEERPGELVAAATRLAAGGVGAFKVKVGRLPFAADLERLAALRDALGPGAVLRADANRAWPADGLGNRLEALARLGLEFVEEPGPPAALEALGAIPVRIALDESLREPEAEARLARLGERGIAPVAVLKPTLLGGLARSLALARLAVAAGGAAVASHAFEGRVAMAAAAALAVGLPGPLLAAGLHPHPGIEVRPEWLAGGTIRPAAVPGLRP